MHGKAGPHGDRYDQDPGSSDAHDVHDVLFGRVRVGLYGGILRDAHKIAIWKRVVVALREFLREIRTERERSIAGARSQQRGALPRLNPAQEPIPVRLLKFARHIRLTNESRVRQLRIFAGYVNTTTCGCVYRNLQDRPAQTHCQRREVRPRMRMPR